MNSRFLWSLICHISVLVQLALCSRPAIAYSRFNLTCYNCDTQYTGDACHTVTRFTPRSTHYNYSDAILFCLFYTKPKIHDGYPEVHRGHTQFLPKTGAWAHFNPCLSSAVEIQGQYENCHYCQMDLCNTGHNSGQNYDVDGITANGSLPRKECMYKNPIVQLTSSLQKKVLSIIRNILSTIFGDIL
uniref:Sodefrin-like factor n=1 Tax=Cacopsylla melanoneura TaxID=428564 RepID=A0A8D9BMF4_9HEMI